MTEKLHDETREKYIVATAEYPPPADEECPTDDLLESLYKINVALAVGTIVPAEALKAQAHFISEHFLTLLDRWTQEEPF